MKQGMNPKKKFFIGAVVSVLVCLFLEGVCFQWQALQTRDLKPFPLVFSYEQPGVECLIHDLEEENVKTIRVTFTGVSSATFVELFMSDDAHRFIQIPVNSGYVLPSEPGMNAVTMRLDVHGALRGLGIYWDKTDANLHAVDLNVPVPYQFRSKRFLLMCLACLAVLAVRVFRLWDIVCDYKNKKHMLCFAVTALLCLLPSVLLFYQMHPYRPEAYPVTQPVAYPFEQPAEAYDEMPHALLFDSLHNGVLHVRTELDEKLPELDNIFDFTQRIVTAGHSYDYWWDYAYYKGKLYVYFGITPVLVFYMPFYLLTGMLPSYIQCTFFLALLTITGGFLCVWELAKRYVKSPGLFALCLTAASAVLGSQVLMLQSCPTRYCISGASEQAFFFLSVWAGLRACAARGKARRIWLVPCAVFTALIVTSRPTGALLAGAWLAVLFVFILLDREQTVRQKCADAAAYLVPVILCGIAIMAYNYARFEDPLEFGVLYQLTSWDMRYSTVSLSYLPKALWHYLFEPLTIRTDFPWFQPANTYINHTGNYYYANPFGNAGAFVVPLTWGNLLYFAGRKDEKSDIRQKEWRVLFAVSAVMVVIVCLLDYSIGGVSERYVCDVLPALCLTGAICVLRLLYGGVLSPETAVMAKRLVAAACVLTLVMAVCRMYGNEMFAIRDYAPQRYISLVNAFSIP